MPNIHECVSLSMIQTPPLPGSFQHSGQSLNEIIDYVLQEARKLSECGFDAVILQNMGDLPVRQQTRPEVIAYFSIIAKEIKSNFSNLVLSRFPKNISYFWREDILEPEVFGKDAGFA